MSPVHVVEYIRRSVAEAKCAKEMDVPYARAIFLLRASDPHWDPLNRHLLRRWAPSTVVKIKGAAWAILPSVIGTQKRAEIEAWVLDRMNGWEGL